MNRIKILLITGIVLFLTGIIGVTLTYSPNKEAVAEETSLVDETFQAVDIVGDSVEIMVTTTKDQEAKVELSGNKLKQQPLDYDVHVDNGTLYISVLTPQKKLYQFDFFSNSLTLQISLPENVYDSLQMENGNGKINAEKIQAKETTITVDNGQINAKASDTDQLDVITSNGKVELSDVKAKDVHTETDNGKISLTNVHGHLTGKTSNGSITLKTNELERMIDLYTDNGRILIETATKPANARFEVSVDNGKVNIFDEFDGSTMFGEGDNLIKLTTSNGKITVTEKR